MSKHEDHIIIEAICSSENLKGEDNINIAIEKKRRKRTKKKIIKKQ